MKLMKIIQIVIKLISTPHERGFQHHVLGETQGRVSRTVACRSVPSFKDVTRTENSAIRFTDEEKPLEKSRPQRLFHAIITEIQCWMNVGDVCVVF